MNDGTDIDDIDNSTTDNDNASVERKLVAIGNSIGVTLPREMLAAMGLERGSWVALSLEVCGPDASPSTIGLDCLVLTKSDATERAARMTTKRDAEIAKQQKALKRLRQAASSTPAITAASADARALRSRRQRHRTTTKK